MHFLIDQWFGMAIALKNFVFFQHVGVERDEDHFWNYFIGSADSDVIE